MILANLLQLFYIFIILSPGITTGLFLVGDGLDGRPMGTPYLLNSTHVTSLESPADLKDVELVLYETSQIDSNIITSK